MQGTGQMNPNEPSELRSVKDRLFGTSEGDRLRRRVAKARFLAGLEVPSGGDVTDASSDSVTETHAESQAPTPEPVRIGRFTVLHKLGQGGMGVVYAAYDEILDRKVALKLLRSSLSRDERGKARMLREAKAMARVRHPNVVKIHDIGTWHGQDYVAMEFVKGQTLNRWVEAELPSWSEILAVMIGAGRGLAEAHHVGLVHRDFKPANILVSEGQAHVLDFGLARAAGESGPAVAEMVDTGEDTIERLREDSRSGDVSRTGSAVFDQMLTADGAVLGTPAYMAPEQHLGQLATELSDQFSFCLVLYEALFGERPHKAETRQEYQAKVVEGDFTVPGPNCGVPKWLREVICRGLAPRAEARWPSMDALLAELERERKRRWRWIGVGATFAAIVAAAVVGLPDAAGQAVCEIDQGAIDETWNDELRDELHARFVATGLAGAEAVFDQTVAGLDDYAADLVAAQRDACEDRWVENRQTDTQLELRMACLDQREGELAAALSVLAEVDASTMARSPLVLAELGEIEMCGRVEELARGVAVPKDERTADAIAAARRDLARAAAAREIGRLDDAELLAADVRARAEQFNYVPLLGEVALLEADNALTARKLEQAREAALRGILHATAADDDLIATEGWLLLASIYARQDIDPGDALDVAAAHVRQLGDQPQHRFALHRTRGRALHTFGQLDDALAAFDQAVALAEAGFDGSERVLVNVLSRRASVLADMGEYPAVRSDLERALRIGDGIGADSPVVLDALFNLAVSEMEAGEIDLAERHYHAALDGFGRVFGDDYAFIGHGHLGLAQIALDHTDYDQAELEIERALEILDPDHPDHIFALDAAATLAHENKRYAESAERLRQALELLDPGAAGIPSRAYYHGRLGRALMLGGHEDEALVEFDRAQALFDQIEPSIDLVQVLVDRAHIKVGRGDVDGAQAILERALELTPLDCGHAIEAATVRVDLARLYAERGNHTVQQLLANEALELLDNAKQLPLYSDAQALAETTSP